MSVPVTEAGPRRSAGTVHVLNGPHAGNAELREQLSNLQGLLLLSMLMTESNDETKIIHLAGTSVPSFGASHTVGVHLRDGGWQTTTAPCPGSEIRSMIERQLEVLDGDGGVIEVPGEQFAMALPLRSLGRHIGYLVAAGEEPSPAEHFLLRVLVQQTGVALGNARLHARDLATADELRRANSTLADTVRALEQTTRIHERFTRVAAAAEGQEGIARALHELTGLSVAVEDRYGNLKAWAGPGQPEPYPKDPPARREASVLQALREGHPMRQNGRLVAIANPSADVLGILALVDPHEAAGARDRIALEHGATVLSMELARLRSLAETELRLRRDLVEELLSGTTDEASALARAQVLGHDLEKPHRAIAVEGGNAEESEFFHVVRRVARRLGLGTLIVARLGCVVILSGAELDGEALLSAVRAEIGTETCRIGVGRWCPRPSELPQSYHEARLALSVSCRIRSDARVTFYDELGVYRLLCEVQDPAVVDRFVKQWLGSLLEYDQRRNAELVPTLSVYLECGGSWDRAVVVLRVHRSTLKYRLQRIREVSGHDLTDPDITFNLKLATRAWRTLQSLST
ncbi:MAG TPA: helix-turn-helix domain-containing protein [Pseudonocardiaceae bacterium]|jgi:sugar diacid utilization regulator|nr:helix-turn-helix domain-containing protein [Pseudonocardiaceae bacterium]